MVSSVDAALDRKAGRAAEVGIVMLTIFQNGLLGDGMSQLDLHLGYLRDLFAFGSEETATQHSQQLVGTVNDTTLAASDTNGTVFGDQLKTILAQGFVNRLLQDHSGLRVLGLDGAGLSAHEGNIVSKLVGCIGSLRAGVGGQIDPLD